MIEVYQEITKYFEITLKSILKSNNKDEEFERIRKNIVKESSKEEFGDFQSNVCLILSKILNKKPKDIANEFITLLNNKSKINNICEELEIAGPGFINIRLKNKIYIDNLIKNINCSRAGISLTNEDNKKIIVDFSSPNIAKEMHVGHLRSTIIGDTISRIFEIRGYDVLRLNHVGDWGTQFGMLITRLQEIYDDQNEDFKNLNIGDLVEFYKEAKKRFDNDINFQKKARAEVVKLQSGNLNTIKAWKLLCNESRKEFNEIYDLLNIKIIERGESFYNSFLAGIVSEIEEKGILVEDQGAKCVFLDGMNNKEGNPLPLIIQKRDGGYNYATTDLAAIKYRFSSPPNGDGAKRIVYVTDHGQSDHFSGVFQVANKTNWIPKDCRVDHVPFGLVQGHDGKKLKTREGKTIRLKDLLSESIKRAKEDLIKRLEKENRKEDDEFIQYTSKVIGISSVKYADLSQNRFTNYQFSFDKMLALNGNTAPYLLYTLVRISGINRKNNFRNLNFSSDRIAYHHKYEFSLLKKLLRLDEVITSIEIDLMPNRLCNYLFELCQTFNRFYDQLPILQDDELKMISRLALCCLTEKTLKLSLNILGINTLERM